MADIAMCKGSNREMFPVSTEIEIIEDFDCPLKMTCYRYLAPADNERQSYLIGVPYDKKKKECQHYWEVK